MYIYTATTLVWMSDEDDHDPMVAAPIIANLDRTRFNTLLYDTTFDLKHTVPGDETNYVAREPPNFPVVPDKITTVAFTKHLHDITAKNKVARPVVQPYTHRLVSPMQSEVGITDTEAQVRKYGLSACTKYQFQQEETTKADHILRLGRHVARSGERSQSTEVNNTTRAHRPVRIRLHQARP